MLDRLGCTLEKVVIESIVDHDRDKLIDFLYALKRFLEKNYEKVTTENTLMWMLLHGTLGRRQFDEFTLSCIRPSCKLYSVRARLAAEQTPCQPARQFPRARLEYKKDLDRKRKCSQ